MNVVLWPRGKTRSASRTNVDWLGAHDAVFGSLAGIKPTVEVKPSAAITQGCD